MEEQKKSLLMRLAGLFKEGASRFVLLMLFLLIFSWPYLSFLHRATPGTLFSYFFLAWLVLVCVLWLANTNQDDDNGKKK